MRLSVFGLGQVGQVLCACFAEQGHSVIGMDVDPAKVADLGRGATQIHESKLADMLGRHAASGLIAATTDPTAAIHSTEISFVCVGTPTDAEGCVDTSHLSALFASLKAALDAKCGIPVGSAPRLGIFRSAPPGAMGKRTHLPVEQVPDLATHGQASTLAHRTHGTQKLPNSPRTDSLRHVLDIRSVLDPLAEGGRRPKQ